MVNMGMKRDAKVMRVSDDAVLDQAVYLWFKQKRMERVPITGPILCEKAIQFSKAIHGEAAAFTASEGWKWRFCQRHGIRQLSLQGEKMSADSDAAHDFVVSFREFVKENNYSMDQIFNCDETGLNFRLLPEKTLTGSFQKSADGRKKAKERVTVNLCSNVSGTIKLPLHVIGKSKKPRCFKGMNMGLLPVVYSGQKNAWMNCALFHEWFHNTFVRKKLNAYGQECKAVLVLDNCSAHPEEDKLVSDDGKIIAKFLPPNVTSLIQPMDQGVIQTLKKRYKKKLLRGLIIADDRGSSIIDYLKSINMKNVVEILAESWDEIQALTLRKSWRKILPIVPQPNPLTSSGETPSSNSAEHVEQPIDIDPLSKVFELACDFGEETEKLPSLQSSSEPHRGYAYWRGVRFRLAHDGKSSPSATEPDSAAEFQSLFEELGFELNDEEISEWLDSDSSNTGVQIYSDAEICDMVTAKTSAEENAESEEEEGVDLEKKCPVSHSEAAHYFEQCMTWLEHQPEATVYNTSTIRELQTLAANKRIGSLKQRRVSKYFKQ